ncbi:uncharacterized protein LOC110734727 [Chenopodium quinoa]|uniref:uncharacterized protein LOC110734727 n=1 Tax=Chenopodium quinoa TaxID=63459 RepID=UPI000B7889C7|nr:uncharacterized protein LOC110734727 [Chenopodium quinoa]
MEKEDKDGELSQLVKDIGCKDLVLQEEGTDSDELKSLHGSDEEVDESPWFREDFDFKKPIVLQQKQMFSSSRVLRKALRNPKRSSLGLGKCSDEVRKCNFKVSARRIYDSSAWQIKELILKHKCMRSKMNACVTYEFLVEKYVEEWRSNPNPKINNFRARVLSDLGVSVGYSQAWLARARVKLMIYGSASEQYSRVWDYGKALLKHNPGSSVFAIEEGIDRPEPPLFLRMYVYVQALKTVAEDDNNQIFPFAWATVEVENKETWGWFLECLKKDFGDCHGGLGLTFMSDRQRGLLEAFQDVMPLAEKNCVRHI